MDKHEEWSALAIGEGKKFAKDLTQALNIAEVVGAIALAAMAYLDVPVKWIVVVGFVAAIKALGNLIIEGFKRLDTGRGYIEQCSSAIEYRAERIEDLVNERLVSQTP
jgi:hypothetical protein